MNAVYSAVLPPSLMVFFIPSSHFRHFLNSSFPKMAFSLTLSATSSKVILLATQGKSPQKTKEVLSAGHNHLHLLPPPRLPVARPGITS